MLRNDPKRLGWLILVALAIFFVGRAAVDRSSLGYDEVETLRVWYRDVAADLPTAGQIGFIRTGTDDVAAERCYFIAQLALVPRVLVPDFTDVLYVISGTPSTTDVDRDSRLEGFALLTVRHGGIRIYRKADR